MGICCLLVKFIRWEVEQSVHGLVNFAGFDGNFGASALSTRMLCSASESEWNFINYLCNFVAQSIVLVNRLLIIVCSYLLI